MVRRAPQLKWRDKSIQEKTRAATAKYPLERFHKLLSLVTMLTKLCWCVCLVKYIEFATYYCNGYIIMRFMS